MTEDPLAVILELGPAELGLRHARRDELQLERRMTFAMDDASTRLLPLDLVPRLVPTPEWELLCAGLEQRTRALNALLVDLAGARECVQAGVISTGLVPTTPLLTADSAPATVAGIDLLHDGKSWRVLEDNLRVPSGIGYAILIREIVATVLPELAHRPGTHPADAVPLLLAALRAAAPPRCPGEPTVAVLSAGPSDAAHAEHRLLADRMDISLLTPEDLQVGDGVSGPDGRIDVLYRRLDELEMPPELLAGLTEQVSSGHLGLANALGTGVADDKAVYAHVPGFIEFYLGESPLLADVPTWVLAEADARREVLGRLHELVLKPVDGYGGRGVTFGADLGALELDELRATIEREPGAWIAQEPIEASTHPTVSADGAVTPCCVDLRAFVVSSGTDTAVTLPAALTRVAPPGSRVVNSSRGGGTKDTWIVGG